MDAAAFSQVHSVCITADMRCCSPGMTSLWNRYKCILLFRNVSSSSHSYRCLTGYDWSCSWATGMHLVLSSVSVESWTLWIKLPDRAPKQMVLVQSALAAVLWVCYKKATLVGNCHLLALHKSFKASQAPEYFVKTGEWMRNIKRRKNNFLKIK